MCWSCHSTSLRWVNHGPRSDYLVYILKIYYYKSTFKSTQFLPDSDIMLKIGLQLLHFYILNWEKVFAYSEQSKIS